MSSILVVEDSNFQRNSIVKSLEKMGYEVKGVADGEIALDELVHTTYDLVITDLTMPNVDGYALLDRLGSEWPSLPTVVLTTSAHHEKECIRRGAKKVVVKPFDLDILEGAVSSVLRS